MMRSRRLVRGVVALLWLVLVASPASATSVADALETGTVGERFDGYLGIVEPPGSAEIRELVESTNAERRAKYAEIAERNGIDTALVARQAAKKLAQRSPPGTWLMRSDGTWIQR